MNMIKLSETTPCILAFEGGVLECFFDEGGSKRIHITHIKGIQIDAASKGKCLLTIKLKNDQVFLWVDEGIVARVKDFVAQIQKEMTTFKL